ncbi:hypothetical protein HK405_011387 [Cladochytrium tenue]|nr:hypothetical protein HK405_011387 [Cladochytrium tenue]
MAAAMRAGFSGGLVVDYPNSTRAKKFFLCLFAGTAGSQQQLPKGLDGEEPVVAGGVKYADKRVRNKRGGKRSGGKPTKGTRDYVLHKKELNRMRGKAGLPANPYRILTESRARPSALPRGARPAWEAALAMYPPGPYPTRQVVPALVGQFIPQDASVAEASPVASSRRRPPAPGPHAYSVRPPPIVYPEDALRERFYSEHPFEMRRPRAVLESDEDIRLRQDALSVKLAAAAKAAKPRKSTVATAAAAVQSDSSHADWQLGSAVTGEEVVQRARHLMSEAGGGHPEEEAYNLALASFYRHREAEELEAAHAAEQRRLRRREAKEAKERLSKAAAGDVQEEEVNAELAWFGAEEAAAIEESKALTNEMQNAVTQRRQVQSEVSQFEARNRAPAAGP